MPKLTDQRETFSISDHNATSYSAAEILGVNDHEKVTYTGKNGWFVARWQAIVIGFIVFLMLFFAVYLGRNTVIEDVELPEEEDELSYSRPKSHSFEIPLVKEALISTHTNVSIEDYSAEMRYLVEPIDYIIYIKPYIESLHGGYERFTFSGNVSITLRVREELKYLVIGAHDLRVTTVNLNKIKNTTNNEGEYNEIEGIVDLSIDSYDMYDGTLKLALDQWLQPFHMYQLLIEFKGDVQNLPYGIFRSFYKDTDKNEIRWMVGTNLDIPFARTVFPCFDAPTQTAMFQLNIARFKNMTVDASPAYWRYVDIDDDMIWQRFQRTEKIPVHMLAFVVSSFYNVHKVTPQIPSYAIWTATKRNEEIAYVLKTGPKIAYDLENYLGTKMPVKKINIFGLPQILPRQKAKMGMIYLSEADLIVQEDSTSEEHKQHVAQLIAAHITEQWIENSVIFQWSHDDWIKEAIVQYFEYLLLKFIEPTWKTLDHFFVEVQQIEMEKEIADPSRTPLLVRWVPYVDESKIQYVYPINETTAFKRSEKSEKIANHPHAETLATPNIYNQLYEKKLTDKGACIIRMIKHMVTEPVFITSLRNFIENSRGKVVNGDDLWDIITEEVKKATYPGYQLLPEGVSLKVVLEDWIYTEGYPLVTVTRNYDKNTITFAQNMKLNNAMGYSMRLNLWHIPISYTTENEKFFTSTSPRFWLNKVRELDIYAPKGLADSSWFLVNPQQTGFYRVQYDYDNWVLLQKALKMGQFPETVRAQLIDDALYLGRSGQLNYEFALNFTTHLSDYREKEYTVWKTVLRHFRYIRNIILETRLYHDNYDMTYSEALERFKRKIRWLITPVFNNLNSKWAETHNLDHNDRLLRSEIFLWACAVDISECNTIARDEFDKWKNSPAPDLANPIEPDMRYAILCSIMQIGGTSDYEFLSQRYFKIPYTNPEKYTYLKSLYCFDSEEEFKNIISITLEEDYTASRLHLISMMWSTIPKSFYLSKVPYSFMIETWFTLLSRFSEFKTVMQTIVEAATKDLQDLSQLEKLISLKESTKDSIPYLEHTFDVAIRGLTERRDWQTNEMHKFMKWLKNTPAESTTESQNKIIDVFKPRKE